MVIKLAAKKRTRIILAERKLLNVDHTGDVGSGDTIPCTLHDSHGLYNNDDEDIEIFVLMVSMEKDVLDATNLGDDLAGR